MTLVFLLAVAFLIYGAVEYRVHLISLFRAAISRRAQAEIFFCSTMSRSLHQPPGQGLGKLTWGRYSAMPRMGPRASPMSCSGWM